MQNHSSLIVDPGRSLMLTKLKSGRKAGREQGERQDERLGIAVWLQKPVSRMQSGGPGGPDTGSTWISRPRAFREIQATWAQSSGQAV